MSGGTQPITDISLQTSNLQAKMEVQYYKNTKRVCQLLQHNTWWSFYIITFTLLSKKLISACVQTFLNGISARHMEDSHQF
jgi:hypothetical protein